MPSRLPEPELVPCRSSARTKPRSASLKADDQAVVEYWSSIGTRRGHALIMARLWFKRLAWRLVVNGSLLTKRALDVAVSAALLVVLSPLLVLVALSIKLEDGGPVLFRQMRVGLRGRIFAMWKFRSMVLNAEALREKLQNEMSSNILFKMKNDPRITRIGKWLRRSSTDELPQLWNVLRGDMSLVGPRPPLPGEVERYRVEDRQRLLAKPGLTCSWQVGGRTEIDFDDQVRLDLGYIKSASLWVDIKLLFQTIPAVWLGKGAY